METIKQMIFQAYEKMLEIHALKPLESEYEYWRGRVDALEDALRAIKIESDWANENKQEALR